VNLSYRTLTRLIAASPLLLAWAGTPPAVNPDSAITSDFTKRVSDYQSLRKNSESKLPRLKTTGSSTVIDDHQHDLSRAIRQARKDAKQGDIFTPPICAEFKRLAGLAMQGGSAWRVTKSLANAEPIKFKLKVNDAFPPGVPQQSMPPTLLQNLPPLPPELQYRLLGSTLVLLDIKANLVVDLAPDVLP
jgi:hypothetical protein